MLRFGRRLIGMGEIIPPQVYLDLGSVFLESGDIRNAVKTFDHADGGLDHGGYQRKVAATFETEALRQERPAQLRETPHHRTRRRRGAGEGRRTQGTARGVMPRPSSPTAAPSTCSWPASRCSTSRKTSPPTGSRIYYYSRNVDRFDKYYLRVLTGFLAASDPGGKARLDLIDDSLQALEADLAAGGEGTAPRGGHRRPWTSPMCRASPGAAS